MPRTTYHIGVLPDCPYDVVYVGSQAFCKHTENVSVDKFGQTHRERVTGCFVDLDDFQIDLIREKSVKQVFRKIYEKTTSVKGEIKEKYLLLDVTTKTYQYREGDIPVAYFMYIIEVEDRETYDERRVGPDQRLGVLETE